MGTKVIMEEAFPYPSEYTGTSGDGVTPIYDRAIGSAAYREIWKTFFSDGIGSMTDDFKLTLLGGFGLSVSGGRYFADGVTGVVNRETVLQGDAPPSDGERTDLVVIQNNYIDRRTYICVKKETEALERNDEVYEIGLYRIRVRVNAAEIQSGDVTDLRSDRMWCGEIMTSDAASLVPVAEHLVSSMDKVYEYGAPKYKAADYRTAGTHQWKVPEHVYYVDAFVMGGGGGSPYASSSNGADCGGGGAGYVRNVIRMAVTPGQNITVSVGDGGKAGTSGSAAGGAGGTSSFNGMTAAGGEAGSPYTSFGSYKLNGRPGAGSSAGGASGGGGCSYASELHQTSHVYTYVHGQGYAAMNANDPGVRYGRGGKSSDGAVPACDVDAGSGGNGGRTNNGTIQGSAGKPGCVIIYAYVSLDSTLKPHL